jgi:hypothetical protein
MRALVGIAGTGLTFGMWWVYDMLPALGGLGRERVHLSLRRQQISLGC